MFFFLICGVTYAFGEDTLLKRAETDFFFAESALRYLLLFCVVCVMSFRLFNELSVYHLFLVFCFALLKTERHQKLIFMV